MFKLLFTSQAEDDLDHIFWFIARRAGSAEVAFMFVERLRFRCEEIARLPFPIGRRRLDLRTDLQSIDFEGYALFLRYQPEILEIVRIVEGSRDLELQMRSHPR